MKRYGIILLTSLILFGCSATQKAEEKEQKDPAVELKQTSIQNSKAINGIPATNTSAPCCMKICRMIMTGCTALCCIMNPLYCWIAVCPMS